MAAILKQADMLRGGEKITLTLDDPNGYMRFSSPPLWLTLTMFCLQHVAD